MRQKRTLTYTGKARESESPAFKVDPEPRVITPAKIAPRIPESVTTLKSPANARIRHSRETGCVKMAIPARHRPPKSSFPRKRESRWGGAGKHRCSTPPPPLDSRFRGNDGLALRTSKLAFWHSLESWNPGGVGRGSAASRAHVRFDRYGPLGYAGVREQSTARREPPLRAGGPDPHPLPRSRGRPRPHGIADPQRRVRRPGRVQLALQHRAARGTLPRLRAGPGRLRPHRTRLQLHRPPGFPAQAHRCVHQNLVSRAGASHGQFLRRRFLPADGRRIRASRWPR